jgi:uncharacterized protein (DUF2236 family)
MPSLTQPLRHAIRRQVRAVFQDPAAQAEPPVQRRAEGLFGPGSVAWRVHGDLTAMLVGGIAGLLLQMLHPAVLAGVWDHSRFRTDMRGRLRRTARFIALTTYGSAAEAEAAIDRVRAIHDGVRGTLPDGTPYAANDPALLAWVHVTETTSFLAAWRRYADPAMPAADQDRYFAEMAQVAAALGADPVPRSRTEAEALIAAMRPHLRSDARTRDVARTLLGQPPPTPALRPLQTLTRQAAIDLLPDWARHLLVLPPPLVGVPLLRAATLTAARTLRWAARSDPRSDPRAAPPTAPPTALPSRTRPPLRVGLSDTLPIPSPPESSRGER